MDDILVDIFSKDFYVLIKAEFQTIQNCNGFEYELIPALRDEGQNM